MEVAASGAKGQHDAGQVASQRGFIDDNTPEADDIAVYNFFKSEIEKINQNLQILSQLQTPTLNLTPDQINKQLDSLARVNSGITSLDRLWDDFSGAATHPASFTTESINKTLSAWNRMRLLGGSLFANLSDIGLQHPLQLWLQNGLPLWRALLNPIISTNFRGHVFGISP